jgi:hypothetical protein
LAAKHKDKTQAAKLQAKEAHPTTYLAETGRVGRRDATNQPKELPVLRMFQDLRFYFRQPVAKDLGPIFAATRQMSRLYATSLPSNLCPHSTESGKRCNPSETR